MGRWRITEAVQGTWGGNFPMTANGDGVQANGVPMGAYINLKTSSQTGLLQPLSRPPVVILRSDLYHYYSE